MSEQQNTQPELTREYQERLPKINMLHVLNLVFCFPIFFYPLLMLLSASLNEAPPGQELLVQVIDIVIWVYPLPLFILVWLFSRIWNHNQKLGFRVIVSAIIIELILCLGFVIFLVQ
ncbi:hypothetical protein CJP74_02220 [Psittacicella melopsittaci]|uniref:Uncharacterized protein n=1 Tax=Psittacicella melopsittaci TaxID=2028576 RepID=A0A3A1Y4U2_9GAMM|nr:DUF5389 family protein [Psittacicella melopsittaci]RIY33263.1 hypothetical protein CJP74_02220 [Psittacicella melopsittaci]